MTYGMPSYTRDSATEIALANQKQPISFYLLHSNVRAAFDQHLQGYDTSKASLHFRRPKTITTTSSGTCSTPPQSPTGHDLLTADLSLPEITDLFSAHRIEEAS